MSTVHQCRWCDQMFDCEAFDAHMSMHDMDDDNEEPEEDSDELETTEEMP